MPSYVFQCTKCGHTISDICSVADGEKWLKKRCPKCRSKLTRPIGLNIPNVHLWYSPLHPRHMRGMRKR